MTDHVRRGWDWRPKVRWFAAEFFVVVTGVLVALALGAFFQQRQNGRSEQIYLSLLSRDIDRTIADLDGMLTFERAQMHDGYTAYRAISGGNRTEQQAAASLALQRLTVRRTLRLKDGTYQDLISTGNLRLIRNRALRDSIVDFFETSTRLFEIINKNNSFFVDDTYVNTIVAQGLIMARTTLGNIRAMAPIETELADSLRGGYVEEPDRLWSLPASSQDWAKVKSVLVMRIRVSAIAKGFLSTHLESTRQLKAAIDAERASQ